MLSAEPDAKRLELLLLAVPKARKVGVIRESQSVRKHFRLDLQFPRQSEVTVIRRLVFAVLLLVSATYASANSYNDVFYDVAEPGWGVFVKQSNTFQFLAFFIYGPNNGQPTWYTAQLYDNGDGTRLNYSGTLYATTGTYFANPWQGYVPTPVGTALFQGSAVPEDYFHATLTYTVNGVSVTKAIQRQTLTSFALSGAYSGSIAGSVSGCPNPANNTGVNGRFNLNVAQVGDTSATLTFSFVDPNTNYNGMVCMLSGPLTHYGGLYAITGAQYSCSSAGFSPGSIVSASVNLLSQSAQGVEGKWTATTSTGCSQTIRFAAVSN
jgi:hypothetical protein